MFYDNFVRLCNRAGKSPSSVATEIGLSRASVSGWKNGKKPTDATAMKLADYLGVSVDYLMGEADDPEIKKAPTLSGEHSKEAQKFAAEFSDFTPDEWSELRRYADFLKSQRSDEGQK